MALFRKKPAASVTEEQIAELRAYVERRRTARLAEKPESDIRYSIALPPYNKDGVTDINRFISDARKDSALVNHPALQKTYHQWEKQAAVRKTFSSEVVRMIQERNIRASEFYKKAGIDKRVFHTMKEDYLYKPSKETAFRCCVGLGLSYDGTTELLKLAGYSLSPSDSRELVLRFCIENRIYDIYSINCLLNAMGEKELR